MLIVFIALIVLIALIALIALIVSIVENALCLYIGVLLATAKDATQRMYFLHVLVITCGVKHQASLIYYPLGKGRSDKVGAKDTCM